MGGQMIAAILQILIGGIVISVVFALLASAVGGWNNNHEVGAELRD
jgi:hypothetical protein